MFSSTRLNLRLHRVKDKFKHSFGTLLDDIFSAIHEEIDFHELETRDCKQNCFRQQPYDITWRSSNQSNSPQTFQSKDFPSREWDPFFIDTKGDPTILDLMQKSSNSVNDDQIEDNLNEPVVEQQKMGLEEGEVVDDHDEFDEPGPSAKRPKRDSLYDPIESGEMSELYDEASSYESGISSSSFTSNTIDSMPIRYCAIHVNKREIPCTVAGCDQSFIWREGFDAHFATDHPGMGPLLCPKCDTIVTDSTRMFMHQFYHHQEGVFECIVRNCRYVNHLRWLVMEHYNKEHNSFTSSFEPMYKNGAHPPKFVSTYYDDSQDYGMVNGLIPRLTPIMK